jgi:hypothetical protein
MFIVLRIVSLYPQSHADSILNSMQPLFVLVSIFEVSWSFAHATCYFPDGKDANTVSPDLNYRPCDSGKEFTMCCAMMDDCRPDGLCLNGYDGLIYRKGCTDPAWESPSCIKLCNTKSGGLVSSSGTLMTYSDLNKSREPKYADT